MRALRFALLALLRDWRSGELAVLLAALLVAVTALTGVGFFTDRIGQAVDQRAAEVIAADLRLRSTEPLAADYDRFAAENGIATARTISFPSVVYFGAESALTAIRAVGPGYPLRGRLKISDAPFEAARETSGLPGRGEAWLDSRLLARIDAGIGDRVSIGAAAFKVTQVLDYRPDQGSAFVDLAPSLLIPLADLDSTGLLGPGKPRDVFAPVRREAGGDSRVPGEAAGTKGEERAPGRGFRGEPADPVLDEARGAFPESLRDDHGPARGGCRRDGGATLHRAAPRQRRTHEMHGRSAVPGPVGHRHRACADSPDRGRCRQCARFPCAGIVDSSSGRPRAGRLAATDARARGPWPGDGARHPRGICTAADAAVEARTAGACAAPQPGTAAAALLAFLRACHCRAARRAVLAGAGREARRLPGGRNRRHARSALRRGILARAPRRAPARRGRRRMALWRREPGAPRAGECRAGRRFRARADGAAPARRRTQRSHAGLAGEPAGGHAQFLHDQHPGHGNPGLRCASSRIAACRPRGFFR